MKTLVSKFNTPEGTVRISNLYVDSYEKKFTATLSFKPKGKRKFETEEISGGITRELSDYFSELKDEYIDVVADNEDGFERMKTGRKTTRFQRYLAKRELSEQTLLHTMVFESKNDSDSYPENPFKVIRYMNGRNTLTLINVSPMIRKEYLDTTTGEIRETYSYKTYVDKDGNTRRSFVSREFWKRLMIQEAVEVEQLEPAL